jgi:hypothetical protein
MSDSELRAAARELLAAWDAADFSLYCPSAAYKRIQDALRKIDDALPPEAPATSRDRRMLDALGKAMADTGRVEWAESIVWLKHRLGDA